MPRLPVAAAVAIFLIVVATESAKSQQTIDDTAPTRTVMGPAWTNDKMKDRVAMILFWAAKEPKSWGPVARAAKLDTELGPFGLVVIGASMQKLEDEAIEAKARSLGVRFSVTDNYGFKAQTQVSVPSTMIFGSDGKLKFKGPSDKAEAKIRGILGAAIVNRAKPNLTGKSMQTNIDMLRKGSSPATMLPGLISRKSDPDARALIDSICSPAKEQLEEAKDRLDTDPVGVYGEAKQLSTVFKGTPVGAQAGELYTKLKNDKLVQQELAAHSSLEKVQKLDEILEKAMKADPSKFDPSSPEFTKMHSAQISQIRMIATQMRASWPKTRATSEASDVAMKYGVMFK